MDTLLVFHLFGVLHQLQHGFGPYSCKSVHQTGYPGLLTHIPHCSDFWIIGERQINISLVSEQFVKEKFYLPHDQLISSVLLYMS